MIFILLACIVFAVGLFDGRIFDLNLVYLGLLLFALGHIWDWGWAQFQSRRGQP